MTEIFLTLILLLVFAGFIYANHNLSIQNKNILFAIIAFIFYFIFAGFRHIDILNDTRAYISHFINKEWMVNGRFEPAYQYLNKYIYLYISSHPLSLLIITSFIIQLLNVRFMYKHSHILWLSIFLFVTLRYYFFSVSGIRQGLAVCLCFFAYTNLIKNKNWIFIIMVLFATTFHYSAWIFFVLLVFKHIKFATRNVIIYGLVGVVLFLGFSIFSSWFFSWLEYGSDYFWQAENKDFSSLGTILLTLVQLLVLYFAIKTQYLQKTNYSKSAQMELWCVFLGILIGIIAIKFGILGRFSYYFAVFSVILIPNIISVLKSYQKVISIVFWVLLSLIHIMTILYLRPEWYNFYPYKFYWQ
jgi:hypothetical protein